MLVSHGAVRLQAKQLHPRTTSASPPAAVGRQTPGSVAAHSWLSRARAGASSVCCCTLLEGAFDPTVSRPTTCSGIRRCLMAATHATKQPKLLSSPPQQTTSTLANLLFCRLATLRKLQAGQGPSLTHVCSGSACCCPMSPAKEAVCENLQRTCGRLNPEVTQRCPSLPCRPMVGTICPSAIACVS